MQKKILLLLIAVSVVYAITAQELTKSDYARAVSFFQTNLVKKILNASSQVNWAGDSTALAFSVQNKQGKNFYKIDFKTMQAEPLFDQERVARLLMDSLKITATANDLQAFIVKFICKDSILMVAGGKNFVLNLNNYGFARTEARAPGGAAILPASNPMESKSPDGRWIAYSKDYNLYIRSTETGSIKQLSIGGKKNYEYGSSYGWSDIMVGENGERPKHLEVSWSPDSKWIQAYICDLRSANKMYLLDWSVDTLYRPRLLSYYRASPGDTGMVRMTPVFYNITSGEEFVRQELRSTHTHPIEYTWSAEPGIVYETNRVRGYQQVDLSRVNLNKKSVELLYQEKSKTNIDTYKFWLAEEWEKLIIASEKDGWRQLYSLDLKSKSLLPITNGNYYVNDISFIDGKNKSITFFASGMDTTRNPYYQYLCRIKANGKDFVVLTPENGNHIISFSPDRKYFWDNVSGPDQLPKTSLREAASGRILKELGRANIDDLLAMNYRLPEVFTAKARDGITTIYGVLWKPSNFDPQKKYPVIDNSYTGPHTNMFPRAYAASFRGDNQALAELGFIVVVIDGMGTANRSKAFHNVSYKNMGQNLVDHVLAIKELAKKYTWVDVDRVGIFGHSAGGYDAGHAVLAFPDFYKVAVASSADHDFRMEKDWWPEMYMGWPVDSTYHQVSNITMAKNLKGKLLIVHGGIDENVNPSATFKLAEALVKADKEFDMLIFPSQQHGYGGKFNDYFLKKQWNYFVEHLAGKKPIWDFPLR